MKRILSLFLALVCVFSLCSCGNKVPATVLSESDISGKKTGVLENSVSELFSVNKYRDSTVCGYSSVGAAASDLKLGIIDCIISDANEAKNVTRSLTGLKALSPSVGSVNLAFMCARERGDLASVLSARIADLTENGTIKNIVSSYFSGNGSITQPDTKQYEKSFTIDVCLSGEPYAYYDGDGFLKGIEVDIIRTVCSAQGIGASFTVTTRDEALSNIITGKADIALGGLFDDGSENPLVTYSSPYYTSEQVIITRK